MDDWSNIRSGGGSGYTRQNTFANNNNNVNNANNNNNNNNTITRFAHAVELNQESTEELTFSLEEQRETFDARTGQAVSFATANNWIVIGTTQNNLIRWYIEAESDQEEKNVITLSTKPDERIYEVFLSPNGKHVLISMTNGVLYYIPTTHTVIKPVAIQKFSDNVQSVAWYQYDQDIITNPSNSTTHNPIQRCLLGTTRGAVYELCLEEYHERSVKKLLDVSLLNAATSSVSAAALEATSSSSHFLMVSGLEVVRASVEDKYKFTTQTCPGAQVVKDNPAHAPRWYVVLVTSSHKHTLYGGPTVESIFNNIYAANNLPPPSGATTSPTSGIPSPTPANLPPVSQLVKTTELPGGLVSRGQLATFYQDMNTNGYNALTSLGSPTKRVSPQQYSEHLTQSFLPPYSYAWLTAAGVYFGEFDHTITSAINTHNATNTSTMIEAVTINEKLLETPKIPIHLDATAAAQAQVDATTATAPSALSPKDLLTPGLPGGNKYLQPISHVLTQFHVIFLYKQHLSVINIINNNIIMSYPLPKQKFGVTRGLSYDPVFNTVWLLTDKTIYEIIINNEERDIWKIYLQYGDYERASYYSNLSLPAITTMLSANPNTTLTPQQVVQHQQKLISTCYAEALFAQGEYDLAAKQYIKSLKTFESVCMKYLLEYQHASSLSKTTTTTTATATSGVGSVGTTSTTTTTGAGGSNQTTMALLPPNEYDNDLEQANKMASFVESTLPQTLFTSSLSALFGPDGYFTNGASDISYHTVLSTLQGAQQQQQQQQSKDVSSLHLLLTNQPTLLTKLMAQTNNNAYTMNNKAPTGKTNTNNNNNNNRNNNTNGNLHYFQTAFQLLEKKWNIYNGLIAYLKLMLTKISQEERVKLTTLCTWVVELYVNTLVSAQPSFLTLTSSSTHPGGNDEDGDYPQQQQQQQTQQQQNRKMKKTKKGTTTNAQDQKNTTRGGSNAFQTELNLLESQRIALYSQECRDLKDFFDDYSDCLHPRTTYQLLTSAGRTEECIYYAKINKDHDFVIDLLLRERRDLETLHYLRSLRVPIAGSTNNNNNNNNATKDKEKQVNIFTYKFEPIITNNTNLIYQVVPILLQDHSRELIDMLIETIGLQPTHVLTAMLRSINGLNIELTTNAIQPNQSGSFAEYNTNLNTTGQNKPLTGNALLQQQMNQKLTSLGINKTNTTITTQNSNNINNNNNNLSRTQMTNKNIDLSIFQDPSFIKSMSLGASGQKQELSQKQKDFIADIARYLNILILQQNIAHNNTTSSHSLDDKSNNASAMVKKNATTTPTPPTTTTNLTIVHNLYILLLIQLLDAKALYNYIVAHKHTTTLFNRVAALRLALPHVEVLHQSVVELCLQLQRHTLAIRFALHYDIGTAKRILKNLTLTSASLTQGNDSTNTNNNNNNTNNNNTVQPVSVELSLWQEYVQLLLTNGYTISQIIQDIRSWNNTAPGTNNNNNNNTNNSTQLVNTTLNNNHNTALLQILPCLPPTTAIGDIRDNVVEQLIEYNKQLQHLNHQMANLHNNNNHLKQQLFSLQQQIITVSVSQRCDVCSQPVLLSPFIHFRCGHVFHVKCSVHRVTNFFTTLDQQANYSNGLFLDNALLSATTDASSSNNNNNVMSNRPTALSKKQIIYLQLLTNLCEDIATTATVTTTTLMDLDDTTEDAQDLQMIAALRTKVLTNTLSLEEELYFIEEYVQQSCTFCGDMMIDSIGLDVTNSHNHNHLHQHHGKQQLLNPEQDWSL